VHLNNLNAPVLNVLIKQRTVLPLSLHTGIYVKWQPVGNGKLFSCQFEVSVGFRCAVPAAVGPRGRHVKPSPSQPPSPCNCSCSETSRAEPLIVGEQQCVLPEIKYRVSLNPPTLTEGSFCSYM